MKEESGQKTKWYALMTVNALSDAQIIILLPITKYNISHLPLLFKKKI